ncbi:MAG: acetyl-CoA carboxylase biotin carboxyl carrier protein [Candidatus Omnitrophica bacterium]|nr:acetyl-CoA carboxylase biotin carboxyl carrier protein [Candidatus Omnitrophota bacterium]
MKPEELKVYADFMKEYELDYMEVRKGDFSLVLGKKGAMGRAYSNRPIEKIQGVDTEEILEEYKQPSQKLENVVYIKAPLVGVFYHAPSPESEPFVELGASVKKGDTLCIIEAMKVMNEIKSDYSGTVSEILVENGKPVEYGQVLFVIHLGASNGPSPAGAKG